MKNLFCCVFFFSMLCGYAQKPALTNDSPASWEGLRNYEISGNGKYVWYLYSSLKTGSTLVFCTTQGHYKKIFPGATQAAFTADSRYLVYQSADGVNYLQIADEGKASTLRPHSSTQLIAHATSFAVSITNWISCQRGDTLLLTNPEKKAISSYTGVSSSTFHPQGDALLLQQGDTLKWIHLLSKKEQTIWVRGADYITPDKTGNQLVFISNNQLCYYKIGDDSARIITSGKLAPSPLTFSNDGQAIYFKLAATPSSPNNTRLKLWSYQDPVLLSQQQEEPESVLPSSFTAVVTLNNHHIIQLENKDTLLISPPGNRYVITRTATNMAESYWNTSQLPAYTLIDVYNGNRQTLLQPPQVAIDMTLSPSERFVTWYDSSLQQYRSYEITTGQVNNIPIPAPLYQMNINRTEIFPYGIGGWLNDSTLFIYDKYDIWQADAKNKLPPINITGDYGKQSRTSFRLVMGVLSDRDTLLLAALQQETKTNGFCKIIPGHRQLPLSGEMENCAYYFPVLFTGAPPPPIKAKHAAVYLLQHQSATTAPNLVVTTDFKHFSTLSNIHPEKSYNWLSTTLLHWPIDSVQVGTGILYKPENFDSTKKYPVIFNYYEQRSNELNEFLSPGLSQGALNIPWYVSNGYLVFVPDIYRPTGKGGEAIIQTITSAVRYLATLPYVDTTKMGLQGHSFGGYETNYIIAHCSFFAAAQSSAGLADLMSLYNDTGFGGRSLAFLCEKGGFNMGTTPWDNPDLYVSNSVIPFANKIVTPLLLLHNKADAAAPFSQSLALFMALRHLKKRVWLLEYNDEGHVLYNRDNMLDFTIRQQQFFDHYLKK